MYSHTTLQPTKLSITKLNNKTMNQQFIKVRSVKDIAISSSFILVGIILALLPVGMGVKLAGCTLLVVGAILALLLKSAYREASSPGIFHKRELFFEPAHKAEILRAIEHNPTKLSLSNEGKGLSIRLDLYYNAVSSRAFLQLFEYVPYEYVAVSEVVECDRSKVEQIIK